MSCKECMKTTSFVMINCIIGIVFNLLILLTPYGEPLISDICFIVCCYTWLANDISKTKSRGCKHTVLSHMLIIIVSACNLFYISHGVIYGDVTYLLISITLNLLVVVSYGINLLIRGDHYNDVCTMTYSSFIFQLLFLFLTVVVMLNNNFDKDLTWVL